jgi:hypothetical protein
MSDQLNTRGNRDQSEVYQICIKGRLGSERSVWFEGMTIAWDSDGNTLLTGPVADQAALHGLLRRDLGMPLVSVLRVEPHADEPNVEPDTPR